MLEIVVQSLTTYPNESFLRYLIFQSTKSSIVLFPNFQSCLRECSTEAYLSASMRMNMWGLSGAATFNRHPKLCNLTLSGFI